MHACTLSGIGHDGEKDAVDSVSILRDTHPPTHTPLRHTHDTAEHEVSRNLRKGREIDREREREREKGV
jgi:hypothetical protein